MLCVHGFVWFHVKYSQLEAQLEAMFFLLDGKLCFKQKNLSLPGTLISSRLDVTEHLHETTSWTEHRRTANW